MTNEERLNQLEKRLTLLKRYNYLLWIIILVTWGGCMAFSGFNAIKANAEVEEKDSKIVTANKFRLVDKDGKIRGYWAIADSLFSELCLVGEDSKAYIALQVHKEGEHFIPSLKMSNGKGHSPGIALLESISGPSLVFWDKGSPQLLLSANKDTTTLSMFDNKWESRLELSVKESKPAIYLKDEKGKVIWQGPEEKGQANKE